MKRVGVAVPGPFSGPLTYGVPKDLGPLCLGQAVLVPLGKRQVTGWVVELDSPELKGVLAKELLACLDPEPVVSSELLAVARQVSNYYFHPLGEVLCAALPGQERAETRAQLRLAEGWEGPESLEPLLLEGLQRSRTRKALVHWLTERGLERAGSVVGKALASGAVVSEQQGSRRRRGAPTELWVVVTNAEGRFERRGPVRDKLWAWLLHRGEALRADILSQFPGASRILADLQERGWVEQEDRPSRVEGAELADGAMPAPTDEQQAVLDELEAQVGIGQFGCCLLQGVTGSGKTEVYLRLAHTALERGKGVLILVPEIALTPQLEERVRGRLGAGVEVIHSGLTAAQRHDAWWRLRRGQSRVCVGVRSAVWAPLAELGFVVVDEEHDGSYKQDEGLCYNARDVAVLRARAVGAQVLMGSATPSLDTLGNVEAGRYQRLYLKERVEGRTLPAVERVSLASGGEVGQGEAGRWFTDTLLEALGQTLNEGDQAMILLNRRGYATYVVCGDCGEPNICPDCDISLVHHNRSQTLRCHLCGWKCATPERCPNCQSDDIVLAGRGTERIEEELLGRFPTARIERMDRDTTRRRGAHAAILDRFRRGDIDILVGTQMIAKGHDMPGVTLVGVLHADAALNLPDFRAAERCFQLLTQVAGRAGRGDRPGRVIFQAFRPDHPVLLAAEAQDLDAFLAYEGPRRRLAGWPPHSRLALLRLLARDLGDVRRRAHELYRVLRQHLPKDGRLLGPIVPMAARKGGRHQLQILLRSQERASLRRWILDSEVWRPDRRGGVRVSLDIDPLRLG